LKNFIVAEECLLNGEVSLLVRGGNCAVPSVVMRAAAAAAVLGSYLAGVAGVQFFAYVGPGADGDLLASSSSTQGQAAASAGPLPVSAAAAAQSLSGYTADQSRELQIFQIFSQPFNYSHVQQQQVCTTAINGLTHKSGLGAHSFSHFFPSRPPPSSYL